MFSQENITRYVIPLSCILAWYAANVTTVILNKVIFQWLEWPYPLSLTLVHMIVCTIGCAICLEIPSVSSALKLSIQRQPWDDITKRIAPLAALFCVNIVLGNISLRWIHVSFMQTVKSSVPAFTVVLQMLLPGQERPTTPILLTVVPIVGGVALATYTESDYNALGFNAALIASVTTASQAIVMGYLLVKKLDPISLLYRMAPISALMLLPFCLLMEYPKMLEHSETAFNGNTIRILILSGVIAFFLNVSQFVLIQKTSALTFTVVGNFKVVLSIIASVLVFGNVVRPLNALGCLAALFGVGMYNKIRHDINTRERLAREAAARHDAAVVTINTPPSGRHAN